MKIEYGYILRKTITHLGKEVKNAGAARWDCALPWHAQCAHGFAQILLKCQKQVFLSSLV